MVKYVIENNIMPPWNLPEYTGPWVDNPSLNSQEKAKILKWINDDLPYRNKNIKLIYPHKKTKTIKKPDLVIKLDKPFKIPSTGFVDYKRLISIPNFSKDKYLKEIEFITKPKVIHHILVTYLDKNNLSDLKSYKASNWHDKEQLIEGWIPNKKRLKTLPENTGIKIPKNSIVIVRIHYETIGHEVIDTKTLVKFNFYSKPPNYILLLDKTSDQKINISPFQKNYKSEIYYKLKKSMILKTVGYHMHLRGKSSSISIQDLNGNETEIFSLKPYSFTFQRPFELKKGLKIPKDYTLICRNYFDNSKENPLNPDPTKNVTTGDYTEENEMANCYFQFLIPNI